MHMQAEIHCPLVDRLGLHEGPWSRSRSRDRLIASGDISAEEAAQSCMADAWAGVTGMIIVATVAIPGPEDLLIAVGLGRLIGLGRAGRVANEVIDETKSVQKSGGRWGGEDVRKFNEAVAQELERRGWRIANIGSRKRGLKEEYLRGDGPGTKGSNYPDITATKNGRTLRVNTIDTLANGKTPSKREGRNAASIRRKTPGDHLVLIPKPN